MKTKIDLLNQIQVVEAPDYLFEQIQQRMNNKQRNTISMLWVGSVAAVFCCLFGAQLHWMVQQSSSTTQSIENLVTLPNNSLYYE